MKANTQNLFESCN